MKKVSGTFKEYSLKKKVRNDSDGEVWLVLGGEGESLCAKLLKDHSPAKQREVEASLQGTGFGAIMDVPMDIAFSRGRFAGYIYQDFNAWQLETPQTSASASTSGAVSGTSGIGLGTGSIGTDSFGTGGVGAGSTGSGSSDSPVIKWGVLCIAIVILCTLNLKLFHPLFLGFVASAFSEDVLSGCQLLSFSGMTAIIGGAVVAILAGRLASGLDMVAFIIAAAISFFIGILLVDVLIVLAVQLVMGVVGIMVAVLPAIIALGIVIWIIKSVFGK